MKCSWAQFNKHLERSLLPVYFIHGDEIFWVQEAIQRIRECALQSGFSESIRIASDERKHWGELFYTEAYTPSFFSEKRLIELTLSTLKLDDRETRLLVDYACHPAHNVICIIRAPLLDSKTQKSAWIDVLEKKGFVFSFWPLTVQEMPYWIQERARRQNILISHALAHQLAEVYEGNDFEIVQEIEKLALLPPDVLQEVHLDKMQGLHARFDIFQLVECALLGDIQRCTNVLNLIVQEGAEPTLVLWALAREIRLLITCHQQLKQGISLSQFFQKERLWKKRQAAIQVFLKRQSTHQACNLYALLKESAQIDRMIKGAEPGNSWESLERLVLRLAGASVVVQKSA